MIGHDPIHPGQAQPTVIAAAFSREKRLEDSRQNIRLDATTVITDFYAHVSARGEAHVAVLRRRRQLDVARLHADAAMIAQGLDGILQNLYERLLHLGLVEFCRE